MKKLEQFLFYFLLFAIPFQTRKILWHQDWNFNEWQSASIYGTDILLLILFGFWIFSCVRPKIEKYDYFLFALIVISAISIKNSSSYILSVYNVLKLIEFVVFYFYIKSYAVYKFGLVNSMIVLIGGGLFQAIIAILQFWKQSSLGLRLLGESILASNLTGVASFYNLHSEKIMRAYGTAPHPNILAAYLFLSIFAFYFIFLYKNKFHTHILIYGYILLLLGLFFTFSRTIIFLWAAGFLVRALLISVKNKFREQFWRNIKLKTRLIQIMTITVLTIAIFSFFYWPEALSRIKISSGEEAVQLRIFYNKESLKSLNWFGVGAGNFVNWLMIKDPNLPRNLYQPVHNIYLLVFSEEGIFGITAFLLFLFFLVKDFIVRTKIEKLYHYSFLIMFLSFLFVGLFDHFLWTLQQGRFIFWLSASLLTFKLNDDIIFK
ncbi:MAG: O-antigen ligase family protein [Candidatus Yanofskybacteria bacterium]|nr:O-antigen ligase family protein [Candidatus Yanofskybacteria bacterium]